MSLDAKPSIPSGATQPDVLQQDEDKSTPIVVNSVAEFIENVVKVNKADGTETFYRGHADKDWVLLPSIFRTPNGIANEHLLFRDMVARLPQSFSDCKSALDYLVQMQHYELPTRLLDVTTNPLVALYFACQPAGDTTVDGIVNTAYKAGRYAAYGTSIAEAEEDGGVLGAIIAVLVAAMTVVIPNFDPEVHAPLLDTAFEALVESLVAKNPSLGSAVRAVVEAAKKVALESASKKGVIYLFSVPKDRIKHYDSDTISVLANLAKCDDSDIDFSTKQSSDVEEHNRLEEFNGQPGIQILLHQIKEEKPYFRPLIDPHDLGSVFLVKAKYGNPRITNQAGAFFLFGLGIDQDDSLDLEEQSLAKGGHMEIPSDWIRHKFIVPQDKKQKILQELACLGITKSYIFPEMEQYAKELKERYNLNS